MSERNGFDYDLFVIGGGSGGVRAARIAAQHGARVGLAEEYRYGGTCVIRGCVPKKLMVFASGFSEVFGNAPGFGWEIGRPTFDWRAFIAAKDAEIARLESIYRNNLTGAGITVHSAHASVTGPHEVRLSTGKTLSAKHILIATGGKPFVPDVPGAEHAITSNEIFDLPVQPSRLMIVGGGYIGSEFAGIFNGLGTHVTQVYRREQILRGFDGEIRSHVAAAMRARGIAIEVQRDVTRIEKVEGALRVHLDNGAIKIVDRVLYATGRHPNTAGLGLEKVGVTLGPGGVVAVDEWSQSSVPSIYAVGDVTGRAELTPVAIREGHAFADTVFGGTPVKPDHSLIPTAVFTQPEIGTVGMTEEAARAQGEIEVFRSVFRPMVNAISGRAEQMLMKLIIAKPGGRVLGCHIVGHGAGEMIQLLAIPMRMGATKADFDATMAVHPTAAEELVTMR